MSEIIEIFDLWYRKYLPLFDKKTFKIKLKPQYYHFDDKLKPFFGKNEQNKDILKLHKNYYHQIFVKKLSDPTKVSSWQFLPFLQLTLPKMKYEKSVGKRKKLKIDERQIMYCGHNDKLLYGYYGIILSQLYEEYIKKKGFESSVLAYRSLYDSKLNQGKSNLNFAKEAFDDISLMNDDNLVAIGLDVEGFFDNLNHKHLKNMWEEVLKVKKLPDDHYSIYKSLTKFTFIRRRELFQHILKLGKPRFKFVNNKKVFKKWVFPKSKLNSLRKIGRITYPGLDPELKWTLHLRSIIKCCNLYNKNLESRKSQGLSQNDKYIIETNNKAHGIPQGSPMSGLLSNIYMVNFDFKMYNLACKYGMKYYRYSDDILIISPLQYAQSLESYVKKEITILKLKIKEVKTERLLFPKNQKKCYKLDSEYTHILNSKGKIQEGKLQYLGLEYNGRNIHIRSSSICKSINKNNFRLKKSKSKKSSKLETQKLIYALTHLGKMNFYRYGIPKHKSDVLSVFDKETYLRFRKQLKSQQKKISDFKI